MRITSRLLIETIQRNISDAAGRMSDLQTKMASAKRIMRPSDDPSGSAMALSLRSTISETDQYLRNIESAGTWLNASEASLNNIEDTIVKAQQLALRASNQTWSTQQLQTLADEAHQLLQQVLSDANGSLSGDYLFAGFRTGTVPFVYTPADPGPPVVPASVAYNGDTNGIIRSLGLNTLMQVNVTGNRLQPLLNTLVNLEQNLRDADSAALSTRIDELGTHLDTITGLHGEIGAKTKSLQDTKTRYGTIEANLKSLLSKTVDLDFAEAITKLTGDETTYKAALAAAGKITQYSLMDYLR